MGKKFHCDKTLHCDKCGHDEFNAIAGEYGWMSLKCTECGYKFDPGERSNFAEWDN